jgi:hypothetical protein
MRFIETQDLADTNPKKYIGYSKIDPKSGKPLCKHGKPVSECDTCGADDTQLHEPAVSDDEIASKHEDVKTMSNFKTNPIFRQELQNLGIVLPPITKEASITEEESPIRKALNIMRTSPNTMDRPQANREVNINIEEAAKWKHKGEALDKEKAASKGKEASDSVKETLKSGKPPKKQIIW